MKRSFSLAVVIGACLLSLCSASSFAQASGAAAASGFENKRPVIGGACPTCPWGAIATIVRKAMQSTQWDVQQCYTCSGEDSVRIVSEARKPPRNRATTRRMRVPESPDAPVDFGVTSLATLANAYFGRPPYTDGPFDNLRAIARIEHPQYLIVAVRRDTFITDLGQIREKRLPARILTDGRPISGRVLEHYGLTDEALQSWGGERVGREARDDFDAIIFRGYLGNSPESNIWYEVTQKFDLRFLELPASLLAALKSEFPELELGEIPIGYLRGVDRSIPTVVRTGQVVYGRDTMPDDFAYALARKLDENRSAFMWSHLAFHYDPATAWHTQGVPLHPGAARYYREKGYMP